MKIVWDEIYPIESITRLHHSDLDIAYGRLIQFVADTA
jgi:hypothetical protein